MKRNDPVLEHYRSVRNQYRLETREQRLPLEPRHFPYWMNLLYCRSIGYYKGLTQSWHARIKLLDGRYKLQRLGYTDDEVDADGDQYLTFFQAANRAYEWFDQFEEIAAPPMPPALRAIELPKLDREGPYTVGHAVVDFLRWYGMYSSHAREMAWNARASILPQLGHIPLDEITPKQILEWMQHHLDTPPRVRSAAGAPQNYKPLPKTAEQFRRRKNTINRHLSLLKTMLNRAYELGHCQSAFPWMVVKPFKGSKIYHCRSVEPDVCELLVSRAPADLSSLIRGALFTACRISELCEMRVHNYDRRARKIVVQAIKTSRFYPTTLTEQGAAFFDNLVDERGQDERMFIRRNGDRWREHTATKALASLCRRLDIEPAITFHMFRHTYASQAIMAGIPIAVVSRQLGHADTRMVERFYGHLTETFVDREIRTKMPDLGQPRTT